MIGVSNQLLLTLITLLTSTTVAQAQFTGCFIDSGCATLVVRGPSSNAEDCCVNNNAGLYYNDGGQCFQCIVYGFGSDNFTRPEAQTPYDFPFGYFKGPSNAQLRVAIDYNGEGTASEEDFGIGQSVVSLPFNFCGTFASITFQADRVALEQDETFVLELSLLAIGVANGAKGVFESSLPNVFFRSRQEFIIQDSTALVFRLRESDRAVSEDNRFIPVEVTTANEVELASDISLLLTPMIAPEDFSPLPTTIPFARANTVEGRIDFPTTPITLNFMAGGEILLVGDVLIFDDLINEALEYFVVTLTFQDPDNVPPITSIESNGGDIIRIDILDNDDIFIGFALPNTTYPEEERNHQIQIIKGEGNLTEQNISFVVNLFSTAPPGLGILSSNDFFFPSSTFLSIIPDENDVFVAFDIFAGDLPEVTEAAQLRLSLPTDGLSPGFESLPQYPSFFIIIEDNDRFRIGFEQTSYTVNEGIGMQEVCVRMFEPAEETPLGTLFVALGVETVQGSADGNDYTEVTGARDAYSLLFSSDTSRRSCFMFEITDDNRYEFEEQFSLRFIALEGTIADNIVLNIVLDPSGSDITILDDTEVTVGFINSPYSAREDEELIIFTVGVTSNHTLNRDIELSFLTVNGLIADFAAMAGLDYTSIINMPIILSAGMQSINISVELINDPIFENNEMFQGILTIISGERVSLSPGTANATIIEDDEVTVGFINPLYSAREDEGPMIFTVGVTSGHTLNIDIELFFSTADGLIADFAAMAGLDYTSITNSPIILSAGMQTIQIAVALINDPIFENDKLFQGILTIISGERVSLGLDTANATIIEDEAAPCQALAPIPNGAITYGPDTIASFNVDTVATHTCDPGFIRVFGSETRVCSAGRRWSGLIPVCQVLVVSLPVRLPLNLRLTTRNIIAPTDGFEYLCVVNGVNLTAQYENERSILCTVGSGQLEPSAGVGSSPAVVMVIWPGNDVNSSTVPLTEVTLYDCRNLASRCSECIAVGIGLEFPCGWCGGSCEVMQECSNTSFITEGNNCPAPVINSFTPMSGPVQGGTAITVNGTDLGVTFADIQNSTLTLGGVACSPIITNFMPGRQFACITTNLGTEGPQNFSLMIGSREAIVNAGSFTAVYPSVNSVTPTFGPMAGGTTVAVSGTGLDVGNQERTRVSLNVSGSSYVCNISLQSIQSHEIRCTTTASSLLSDATVVVSIDDARISNPGLVFSYLNNPNVINVSPSNTISSGGIMLTFTGLYFDVVQQRVLEVYPPTGAPLRSNCSLGEDTTCSVVNITTIRCSTPNLSMTSLTALDYALLFDDVPPGNTQARLPISVQSDPSNFRLNSSQEVTSGIMNRLRIVGDNIDSVETSEIHVTVGGEECVLTSSERRSDIICTAPLEPPGGENPSIINVTVGSKIAQVLDKRLTYNVPVATVIVTPEVPLLEIVIPLSAIIVLLAVCVLIVLICLYLNSRKKSLSIGMHQQNMELVATGIYQEIVDGNTALVESELDTIAESIPDSFKIPSSILKLSSTAIGQGEFGIVYKGVLTDWNDVPMQGVAVKTLKGLFSFSDVQSMVCEVNKMQDLNHPHVMSLIGVCLDAGPGIAIVMPYMANGSLFDYLKRERGILELDDDCEIYQGRATARN
ncbi:uncharacterized protein LOC135335860 isoform X4 [Halichondria panicea]|uniref:uncharacterized protein LOC135335860 isoform X4 n=1 Tax=Halichondria panicea TaxID=6063 RepID=UPI00312BA5B1